MNDLDRPMLLYYVIYYQKFKKVMQQTEKEALSCLFVDVFSPHIYAGCLPEQTVPPQSLLN